VLFIIVIFKVVFSIQINAVMPVEVLVSLPLLQ